ncbi:MAG: hypothetical protein V1912_11240, partial [bacterium]
MHVIKRAPAKVNLSLLVGPRDQMGYHELFTVFAPVDVHDELEFTLEARPGGRAGDLLVKCRAVDGEANLVAQALRALERETGWVFSGQVTIGKGIPMGAGLGGGSTDAAVSLQVGAEVLAEAGGPAPDGAKLRSLARALGADVPFFLDPSPAIGRGIGELLEPIALPALPLVLVFPEEHLSTARVYRAFDSARPLESREAFAARSDEAEGGWRKLARACRIRCTPPFDAVGAVAGLLQNDLEEASFGLVPELVGSKEALTEEGARGALMSGSGPTLFGLCSTVSAAEELADRLVARGFRA